MEHSSGVLRSFLDSFQFSSPSSSLFFSLYHPKDVYSVLPSSFHCARESYRIFAGGQLVVSLSRSCFLRWLGKWHTQYSTATLPASTIHGKSVPAPVILLLTSSEGRNISASPEVPQCSPPRLHEVGRRTCPSGGGLPRLPYQTT